MKDNLIKTLEKSFIVGVSVIISIIICRLIGVPEFFAGIVSLTVINLNDSKTRKQALERTIATICGGIIACIIVYSGFQENMFFYLIGLMLICIISEFLLNIPASVGCIVLTYIMLNIDSKKNPQVYVEERVLATMVGALIISLIITLYNRLLKKEIKKTDITEKKNIHSLIEKATSSGIAVIIVYFIVSYMNRDGNSRYFTKYTLYYSALASIMTFHIDLKKILHNSKERLLSTIFGGIVAIIFFYFNLHEPFWIGVGVVFIVIFVENFIRVSPTTGGVVFLFIMVNIKEEITPLSYYMNRVFGTIIGLLLIISVSAGITFIKNFIKNKKMWKDNAYYHNLSKDNNQENREN